MSIFSYNFRIPNNSKTIFVFIILVVVFGNVSCLPNFSEFHPSELELFLDTKNLFLSFEFLGDSTYEPLVNNDRGLFFFKDGSILGSANKIVSGLLDSVTSNLDQKKKKEYT